MAKGTELASAYVTLLPSLKGAESRIEKELAKVDVSKVGKDIGDELGKSIGDAAGDALGDGIDTSEAEEGFESLGTTATGWLGKIAKAAPIAGAAVASIGAVAFDTATDFEKGGSRIEAAVGGAGEEAEALKAVGETLYTDGWGESMTALSDDLIEAREILGDISETDMTYLVEGALALEEVYGSDLNETLRGARVLMERFGLSAEDAMDLMVAGTQRGLDYTNEMGDNLSEYAGRWADAGVEASEYFSLLEAGADNGAYQLDKVGDFLNEFLTSLTDGRMEEGIGYFSEGTQEVFESFKSGGADARDVLDAVVGELADMPDGYEKAQIASELWSSLGEDNAMSMIESLADVEDTFGDVAGASQEMTEQVQDDLGSKWDAACRKWQAILEPVGEVAVDLFGGLADLIGGAGDAFTGFVNQQSAIVDLGTWFDNLDHTTENALTNMGYNLDLLKLRLSEAGMSTVELDEIGSARIRSLASKFNGDVDSMVWALENYNKTPFVDKDSTVSVNDAELIDAQGRVVVWNGTELVYKESGTSVDDGDLLDAQGNVYTWNGTTLKSKSASATITGNIASALTLAGQWNKVALKNKSAGVYINNSAALMASGGIIGRPAYHADGAVIKHADGYIANRPGVGMPITHVVGEAGAEAVIPLTNRHYSQPFADVIADGLMRRLSTGGGSTNHIYIDSSTVAVDSRIAQALSALLGAVERRYDMGGVSA